MDKRYCDLCGCEMPYGLGEIKITTVGVSENRDQAYFNKNINHLCTDCMQKYFAENKYWVQANMSDKNKERIKD